ncbi:DUF502 domain-containing protein [Azohydromonas sp.]|uniref:DUF502 domain-containing protein n=1 Tax=Azohydromonas sp. TaxID=1872666 RepID=UPI002C12B320|nr:DUF502 domain-containing protein [Azohydromonas sp.]HMM84543.1 DUF502 domain-containing protein [Azohydromonas sp.]
MTSGTRTLIRIFATGLLAALPLAATIAIFVWAANVLLRWLGPDSLVGGVVKAIGFGVTGSEVVGYLLGVAVVAALVFGLGVLVETGLQRGAARLVDGLVTRIPLVSSVYGVIRRMVELFSRRDDEGGLKSMRPVWCHFGGPGGATALALLSSAEPVLIDGRRCIAVLVPTAPVPVGGGLLWVPEHWVTPAEVGIEALTSIYVSMGVTSSQYLPRAGAERAD